MKLNEADEMMNDALANPQRATWTARREMQHVLEIMRHLYDDNSQMVKEAELAFILISRIDDMME